jgi:hypothetical protein
MIVSFSAGTAVIENNFCAFSAVHLQGKVFSPSPNHFISKNRNGYHCGK